MYNFLTSHKNFAIIRYDNERGLIDLKMTAKKITIGGLLIALSLVLPSAFHLLGVPQPGKVFLPMHIPVLLGGFTLGPVFGLFIGTISPLISSFLTGMPTVGRLPFMMIELAVYGFSSGLIYKAHEKKKFGIYISLMLSMLLGRLAYALALFTASNLMGVECGGVMAAVSATVSGFPGIITQLVIIPPIIYSLERSGYLDKHLRKSKSTAA